MSLVQKIQCRHFSNSTALFGKRNFRKFNLYENRMTNSDKQAFKRFPSATMLEAYDRGIRNPGTVNSYLDFTYIPTMEPELIVPDLTGFKLKPYVSYRVKEITTTKFTETDLFYHVYAEKIKHDFLNNKLNDDGSPVEPSPEESLSENEARNNTKKTGSDVYGYEESWIK